MMFVHIGGATRIVSLSSRRLQEALRYAIAVTSGVEGAKVVTFVIVR